MQGTHLFLLMMYGLTLIKWDLKMLFGIVYIIFNISSLVFILVGAVAEEKAKKTDIVEEEKDTKKKGKKN